MKLYTQLSGEVHSNDRTMFLVEYCQDQFYSKMFLKIKMFTSVFGISNESKPLFGDSFIFFVLIYDRQLKVK